MGEADEQAQPSDAQIPLNDVEVDRLLREAEVLAQEVTALTGVENPDPDAASALPLEFDPPQTSGESESPEEEAAPGPLAAIDEVGQQILSVEDILANADMDSLAAEYDAARAEAEDAARRQVAAENGEETMPSPTPISAAETVESAEAAEPPEITSPADQAAIEESDPDDHDDPSIAGSVAAAIVETVGAAAAEDASDNGPPPPAPAPPSAKQPPSPPAAGTATPDGASVAIPASDESTPGPSMGTRWVARLVASGKTFYKGSLRLAALPLNIFLVLLIVVNYPFRKLSPEAKLWIGMVGLLSLLMGGLAFLLPKLFGGNPYEDIQKLG